LDRFYQDFPIVPFIRYREKPHIITHIVWEK
jgi:hypothetical protein